MKLPIELINYSAGTNDASIIAARGALQNAISDIISLSKLTKDTLTLPVEFNLNSVATINQFFLDVILRLSNILKSVESLQQNFESFQPSELEELIPNKYSVFGTIDVDALRDAVGQLEILRYEIINDINSLMVQRLDLNRRAEFALDNIQQLSEEVTTDTHKLNNIQYSMGALNPYDMETVAKVLESVSVTLEEMVVSAMDDLNSSEAATYHENLVVAIENFFLELDGKLSNLEILYTRLYTKYEIVYKQLTTLKEKSRKLYVDIINGAYIRSGRHIRVFSTDTVGAMTVSAWKPKLTSCPTWEPEYIQGDIKVSPVDSICDTDSVGIATPRPSSGLESIITTTARPTGTTTPVPTAVTSPLELFKNSCNPVYTYWTKEESTLEYVSLLRDGSTSLDPNNPTHVTQATEFFKTNYGGDITQCTNFLYGISFNMKFAGFPNLIIGGANFTTHASYLNTVDNFHKCLYEFYTRLKTERSAMQTIFANWNSFNNHLAEKSITLTTIQKFCVFMTYHWFTYVTATSQFSFLTTSAELIDSLAKVFKPTDHACQRISFAEQQASTSLMAFAYTSLGNNLRVVNVESDSQTFDPAAQSPTIFRKGQIKAHITIDGSGKQVVSGSSSWAIEKPGVPDPTIADGITPTAAHKMMYVAVHEAAHTVDYAKGKELGTLFGYCESALWLNISGWTKSGDNWRLPTTLTYPSEALGAPYEPPVTFYGHSMPAEDFAESWTAFVIAPDVMRKWWPKRHSFFTQYVVPFMSAEIRR